MSEIDYQMALVLQYRFNKESKSNENTDFDYGLALKLQEEFNNEVKVERPDHSLVYKATKTDNTKCLVDPSWEVIDPTPDVHVLFVAFNQRFFGNVLVSVSVAWSKRMTSCAGICSYQARGGMCSITLSEPLLKLRPRKDLVETLLHEMIHAYLFVTHNNRDRDGHGPEFHKHMYRINAEAGTSISVYHDFHDEVKLYQQHWWRCDGPCQTRQPFFGMVRRATNRAPGPNDLWWNKHLATCGGTFVKVKSPDPKTSKSKKTEKVNPKNDIRNYITSVKEKKKIIANDQIATQKSIPSISNNIHGFVNMDTGGTTTKKPNGVLSNNIDVKPFTGKGNSLNENAGPSSSNVSYATVREHWLKKFDNGVTRKRPARESTIDVSPPKQIKLSDNVQCPVCLKSFQTDDLNTHLDRCLETGGSSERSVKDTGNLRSDMKSCPVCKTNIVSGDYEFHIQDCLLKSLDNIDDKIEGLKNPKTPCLACSKDIFKSELDSHLEECLGMSNVFDTIDLTTDDDSENRVTGYNCPVCLKMITAVEMETHLQGCLKIEDFNDDFSD